MNQEFLHPRLDGKYVEHCAIDYRAFDKKASENKAKLLRAKAESRGWLFREAVA